MEVISIGEIIRACRGTPYNIDTNIDITSINTDTRKVRKGELFIPLKGERFDGHNFIEEAFVKGAAVALSEVDLLLEDKPYIVVENTLTALQDIAQFYKDIFNVKIVAVTGSSGKTTTKDMIASVLAEKYKVLKTEGNLNNAIGLPLTLFNIEADHEVIVLEMGMSSLGEIERLAEIAKPHIGVITNVGSAHIEKLVTRENILRAKMELFTYFNNNNLAIINGDNDMLSTVKNSSYRLMRFGTGTLNDYVAYDIVENGEAGISFKVNIDTEGYEVIVPVPGLHNVYNALSAIGVGLELGMDMKSIINGILNFRPSKLRMDIFTNHRNIRIINDSYNANPESMKAAVDVLKSFNKDGNTTCILGDMLELGDSSKAMHEEVGQYSAASNIGKIITIGKQAANIAEGAIKAGYCNKLTYIFETRDEAISKLKDLIQSKETVLIKGSRGMKMEAIVEFLRERG